MTEQNLAKQPLNFDDGLDINLKNTLLGLRSTREICHKRVIRIQDDQLSQKHLH